MTEDHLNTILRAILGNQVQMMNALAMVLHDGKRGEFAEMVLEQAEISQRLCDGLDRAYPTEARERLLPQKDKP
jgi:hypothetical protein